MSSEPDTPLPPDATSDSAAHAGPAVVPARLQIDGLADAWWRCAKPWTASA